MDRPGSRGLRYNGNNKQAGNSQRPLGIGDDYVGNHGPQRTVSVEKEEEKGEEVGEEEENKYMLVAHISYLRDCLLSSVALQNYTE